MARGLLGGAAMQDASVQWVLSLDKHRITCSVQPEPRGAHLATVYYDGLPVKIHRCFGTAALWTWSERVRDQWQAYGWKAETPVLPEAVGQ